MKTTFRLNAGTEINNAGMLTGGKLAVMHVHVVHNKTAKRLGINCVASSYVVRYLVDL
jgi:hypothetical protein